MAAGVFVGFCAPPLAALAKPLLAPALVIRSPSRWCGSTGRRWRASAAGP
jgi:hypothetical protein